MAVKNAPILTIEQARSILGESYAHYPDADIQNLIESLDSIARTFIQSVPKY